MSNDHRDYRRRTLIKPFMGRNRLGTHPRYSTRAWNCAKTASGRWKVGKDRPLFAIDLTNQTSSLPLYMGSSSATISSHAVFLHNSPKYQGWVTDSFFFSFHPTTVLSQFFLFCSFSLLAKEATSGMGERSYITYIHTYIRSRINLPLFQQSPPLLISCTSILHIASVQSESHFIKIHYIWYIAFYTVVKFSAFMIRHPNMYLYIHYIF